MEKYPASALPIKLWIMSKISPFGWSLMITRALPELMELNPKFSAFKVNKKTVWSYHEIRVIYFYLLAMNKVTLNSTDELLNEADKLHWENQIREFEQINFVGSENILKSTFNKFLNFFKR